MAAVPLNVREEGEAALGDMGDELQVDTETDSEEDITDDTASIDSIPTPPGSPLWLHRSQREHMEALRLSAQRGEAAPAWATPAVIPLPDGSL